MKLTDEEIAAITARADAATTSRFYDDTSWEVTPGYNNTGCPTAFLVPPMGAGPREGWEMLVADAEFFAVAKRDMHRLLAELGSGRPDPRELADRIVAAIDDDAKRSFYWYEGDRQIVRALILEILQGTQEGVAASAQAEDNRPMTTAKSERVRAAEARVIAAAEADYDDYDGPFETALTLAVIELRKARAS